MLKKALPVMVILGAAGVGVGGGAALRLVGPAAKGNAAAHEEKAPEASAGHAPTGHAAVGHAPDKGKDKPDPKKKADKKDGHGEAKDAAAIMKFSRQFVVPTVRDGAAVAMTILDISLVLDGSVGQDAYASEMRLRDAFVGILLGYAGNGRLAEIFEDQATLDAAKADLLQAAQTIVGDGAREVLVVDIGYQEY